MNPMPLLLALLVVAYIGSLYTSKERKRSFGSASGFTRLRNRETTICLGSPSCVTPS